MPPDNAALWQFPAFLAVAAANCLLLPLLFLRTQRDMDITERCWCAVVLGSAFWICVTTALALWHVLDIGGILIVCVCTVLLYARLRARIPFIPLFDGWRLFFIVRSLDYLERKLELPSRQWAQGEAVRILRSPWNYRTLLTGPVFCYGAYVRMKYSVMHEAYGLFDPYVHLVFMKRFFHGDLYYMGMYPRGEHALLCSFGAVSGMDPNTIVRFAGGLAGALIGPALYFLLVQCNLQWTSALFGAAVWSVCDPFGLKPLLERQTSTFPQEFAVIFALVGLGFAIRFLRLGNPRDRWIFVLACFITWAAHSLVGVILFILAAGVAVDYLRVSKDKRRLILLVRETAIATVAGNLYLIVGFARGSKPYEQSLQYVLDNTGGANGARSIPTMLLQQLHLVNCIIVAAAVILLVFALIFRKVRFVSPGVGAYWSLSMVALLIGKVVYHIPVPTPPDRLVDLLPLFNCAVIAWMYELVIVRGLFAWRLPPHVPAMVAAAFIAVAAVVAPAQPPVPPSPQHDEAMRLYEYTSSKMEPGKWMIVGQNEEYEMCLDRGIHMNVQKLLTDYDPAEAVDLSFPVPFMYIIHEKRPPSAWKDFENSRESQEQRLGTWLQIYGLNSSDLQLFMDTPNVAIYLIDSSKDFESRAKPPSIFQ